MEDVVASAKSQFHVDVRREDAQSRCGSDLDFRVVDIENGKTLGTIPLPQEAVDRNDGRFLTARLKQLLATPRLELFALQTAHTKFYDDASGMREKFNVSAYVPNAFPIEKRVSPDGQSYLVFVTIEEHCTAQGTRSPSAVSQDTQIKTIEYVPGRTDYPPSSIYQAGDLQRAIFENRETMNELRAAAMSNVLHCRTYGMQRSGEWKELLDYLTGSRSKLYITPLEQFASASVNKEPKKAWMLNSHRLAVELEGKPYEFAGTMAELIEVQARLQTLGLTVDKSGQLDWKGKIEVEVATRYSREMPTSLRP